MPFLKQPSSLHNQEDEAAVHLLVDEAGDIRRILSRNQQRPRRHFYLFTLLNLALLGAHAFFAVKWLRPAEMNHTIRPLSLYCCAPFASHARTPWLILYSADS